MIVRKTQEKDIEEVLEIYDLARDFMRKNNNPDQWQDDYPSLETLKKDMEEGVSYIIQDGPDILATFAFIIGDDPYYDHIENGSWSFDKPYGTIHRIASNGKSEGIAYIAIDFALEKIPYLRIDTHEDNQAMQNALKDYGFKECGIIYVRDKSPRVAFDYHHKENV